MKIKSKIAVLYLGTSFFTICGIANSATVTGSFVGTVYLFGGQENFSPPPGANVAIGDQVTGFFSYDTGLAEVDTESLQFDEGVYGFPVGASSTKLSFSINNSTWTSANDLDVHVRNGVDYGSYTTFDGLSLVSQNSSNRVTSGAVWPTSGFETIVALDFLPNSNLVNSLNLPTSKNDIDLSDVGIFGGINTLPLSDGSIADNGYTIRFSVDSLSFNFPDGVTSLGEAELGPIPMGELTMPRTNLVGDVGADFDPTKPTIVLTHGWQRSGVYSGTADDVPFTSDFIEALERRMGSDVNIVSFVWEDAYFQNVLAVSDASKKIEDGIGLTLALDLKSLAGSNYSQPMQFIGHSLGSEINVLAARFSDQFGLNVAQVTTLDAPIGYGVPSAPYKSIAQNSDIGLLDNYYGTERSTLGGAFGGTISGWKFDGGLAFDTDHGGVWQEYLETVNDISANYGFYYSVALGNAGGYLEAVSGAQPNSPPTKPTLFETIGASFAPLMLIHGEYNPNFGLGLSKGSNGYANFQLDKPEGVTSLMFDLLFSEASEGDYLEIVLDNKLLSTLSASLYAGFTSTIFLDLEQFSAGSHDLYFLLVDRSEGRTQLTASNFQYLKPISETIAPVPIPPSGFLILFGIAALAAPRWKKIKRPMFLQFS